jgi:NAD(P)-dependent dehydrogenase (short-subunit alcohol dehydrogenase family)
LLYLDGKIGIVTGAAGGLGFEIAKELSKHVALEYGQYNIRSFSVALGDIYTEAMRRSLSRIELLKAKRENTMKRLGRPEEIAKSIVSIAGDNFSFSTGNTIIIDGGKIII